MAEAQRYWRKRKADIKMLVAQSDTETDDNRDENIQCCDMSAAPLDRDDSFLDESGESSQNSSGESFNFSSDPSFNTRNTSDSDVEIDFPNETNNSEMPDLAGTLAAWSVRHSCTRTALNEILAILRSHGHSLPKDGRTLLQTPSVVTLLNKCGGQYAYFGLESGIRRNVTPSDLPEFNHNLNLMFNVDGVPLFKSTNLQFWPILCSVNRKKPFIVALFCGNHKPDPVEDYLEDFLHELIHIQQQGINFENVTYRICVKAFICDAPARAYLKCTKSHSGYYSCERCIVKGSWNGRVVYNSEDSFPLRSSERFRSVNYPSHQLRKSPLIDIGIPCVELFPLDYMHLVSLGVMKRILVFITRGPTICRLSHQQRAEISGKLERLTGQLPSEFARQPRTIAEMDRWKATEFRQFLLYTGPVVLLGSLSSVLYKHFLTFSVAVSILLTSDDQRRAEYTSYARDLLEYFVKKCKQYYGSTFTVYNVHNLLHLHEDVLFHQLSLNEISGFQFENYLHDIKKLVRNSQNPIAQVKKRLAEMEKSSKNCDPQNLTSAVIHTRRKDFCFFVCNNEFAFIREIVPNSSELVVDCIKLRYTENFFENPCQSKLLDIVYVKADTLREHSERKLLRRNQLLKKVACLDHREGYVLFPLLHGMERSTI